jgi:hypothetical protein
MSVSWSRSCRIRETTHEDNWSLALNLLLKDLGEEDASLLRFFLLGAESARGRVHERWKTYSTPRKVRVESRSRRVEDCQRQRDACVDGCQSCPLDHLDAAHCHELVLDKLFERAAGFEERCEAKLRQVCV